MRVKAQRVKPYTVWLSDIHNPIKSFLKIAHVILHSRMIQRQPYKKGVLTGTAARIDFAMVRAHDRVCD